MKVIIDLDDIDFHIFTEISLTDNEVKVKGILNKNDNYETVEYVLSKNRVSFENVEEYRCDYLRKKDKK